MTRIASVKETDSAASKWDSTNKYDGHVNKANVMIVCITQAIEAHLKALSVYYNSTVLQRWLDKTTTCVSDIDWSTNHWRL